MPRYFATCARGLEKILSRELDGIAATEVKEQAGGVEFVGDQACLYRLHVYSRVANRVFFPLREAFVRHPDEVYEMVKSFKWETFLRPGFTFAVDTTVSGNNSEHFRNSHFLRLRVKDAVCDRLREKRGERPDIDTDRPNVSLYLYLRNGKSVLGLDATGHSLHERGYRLAGALAPLKETLAAGIIGLSGWDGKSPFYDPMCGSGTLIVEAYLHAANWAPGLLRKQNLFMNWPEFNEQLWKDIREEAKAKRQPVPKDWIFGSDRDGRALDAARFSLRKLGLNEQDVKLMQSDFSRDLVAPSEVPGVLMCNPPYGERLGDEESLKPLYKEIGDTFKHKFSGWKCFVFTGSADLAKEIGLRSSRRIPLFNGPIECRLLQFDMYSGAR